MDTIIYSRPQKIKNSLPAYPEEIRYYTEVLLHGEITLPDPKPDIEKILEVNYETYIKKITPIEVKLDDDCLTEYKFLIPGYVHLGIEYSSLTPEQTVHYLKLNILFDALLKERVKEHCSRTITNKDLKESKVCAYIEHLKVEMIDSRTMEYVIVLLIWLKPTKNGFGFGCKLNYRYSDSNYGFYQITKQIALNHKESLPDNWPDIKKVLDSKLEVQVRKVDLVNTPIYYGTCRIPVKKVVVIGKALITTKYTIDTTTQDVYGITYEVPIKVLIEWPGGPSIDSPQCIQAIEEYFDTEQIDKRSILALAILRLEIWPKK